MAEFDDDIVYFAKTNFRNQQRKFGIKLDDRRRHMYFIGKTGMGKTTVLENMMIQDVQQGRGLAVIDPHGDFVEKIEDPIVKSFWVEEYSQYQEKFRTEAIAPIQNKIGQFLSSSLIRNVVGQPKSSIDLREVMDNKKILLLNLA